MLTNFFIAIKNTALDILFPPVCFGCKNHLENRDKFICDGCLASIKINNTLFCPVCQARLPENKRVCSHGLKKTDEFPYLLAAAASYDDKIVRDLIHSYKYEYFDKLSSVLGAVLAAYLDSVIKNSKLEIKNFSVTYIPLHLFRERTRGFNQSKLLAEIIAEKFNLEIIGALQRVRNNPPQAKISKNNRAQTKNHGKRQKNISNAFEIAASGKISGKNIILVDDVYTSGATISEAAKILKRHGANKIIALVVARA